MALSNAISNAIRGGHPFTGVILSGPTFYWSSTTDADRTDYAWNVNMYYNNVSIYYKAYPNHVWPVRAGQ